MCSSFPEYYDEPVNEIPHYQQWDVTYGYSRLIGTYIVRRSGVGGLSTKVVLCLGVWHSMKFTPHHNNWPYHLFYIFLWIYTFNLHPAAVHQKHNYETLVELLLFIFYTDITYFGYCQYVNKICNWLILKTSKTDKSSQFTYFWRRIF